MSLNTCTIIVLLLKRIKDSQYASQWFPFCHCFSQYLVSLAGAPCDPYMQLLACSAARLPYLHSAVFLLRWFFVCHSGKNQYLECWHLRGVENWSTQINISQSKRARTNNKFNQLACMALPPGLAPGPYQWEESCHTHHHTIFPLSSS